MGHYRACFEPWCHEKTLRSYLLQTNCSTVQVHGTALDSNFLTKETRNPSNSTPAWVSLGLNPSSNTNLEQWCIITLVYLANLEIILT